MNDYINKDKNQKDLSTLITNNIIFGINKRKTENIMKLRALLEAGFCMKSSLENSIIAWNVALKKTSNKEKQAHLKKRIATAEKKLDQLQKNTK